MALEEPIAVSVLFMVVLLVWALGWMIAALYYLISRKTSRRLYWKTAFFWNIINLLIASATLVSIRNKEFLSKNDLETNAKIVFVNVLLDVCYLGIALVLKRRLRWREVGEQIQVQAIFLLTLDLVILLYLSTVL